MRRVQRRPAEARQLHPARRHAGRRAAAPGAHARPPRRAQRLGAVRGRPGAHQPRRRCCTSTGSRTCCSSSRASPTPTATCCGARAASADRPRGDGRVGLRQVDRGRAARRHGSAGTSPRATTCTRPRTSRRWRPGVPLTDADRVPWLRRVAAWIADHVDAGRAGVITCSALKRSYRDLLRGASGDVVFVVPARRRRTLDRAAAGRAPRPLHAAGAARLAVRRPRTARSRTSGDHDRRRPSTIAPPSVRDRHRDRRRRTVRPVGGRRLQPRHEAGVGALAERQAHDRRRRRGTRRPPPCGGSACSSPRMRRAPADHRHLPPLEHPVGPGADARASGTSAVRRRRSARRRTATATPPPGRSATGIAPGARSMNRCRARTSAQPISTSNGHAHHDDVDDVHGRRPALVCVARQTDSPAARNRASARSRAAAPSGRVGLGAVERCPGPRHVDLVGRLGHLGEHRHAVLADGQEPAVHRDASATSSPSRSIRTDVARRERTEQRRCGRAGCRARPRRCGRRPRWPRRTRSRVSTETSSTCIVSP